MNYHVSHEPGLHTCKAPDPKAAEGRRTLPPWRRHGGTDALARTPLSSWKFEAVEILAVGRCNEDLILAVRQERGQGHIGPGCGGQVGVFLQDVAGPCLRPGERQAVCGKDRAQSWRGLPEVNRSGFWIAKNERDA